MWSKIFEKKLSNGKKWSHFLVCHKIKTIIACHLLYLLKKYHNSILRVCINTCWWILFIFSSLKCTSGLSLYFMFYHICFLSLFQGVWRWFSACCTSTQVWILSIHIQKIDMVVCTFNLSIGMVWGTRTKRSRKIFRTYW